MIRAIRRAMPAHRKAHPDDGAAMVLVLGFSMVLMLVTSTMAAYTTLSVGTSRREQDYHAALATAQAGVDDYMSRLNANRTYWQTTDCTNTAMRRPFPGAPPCGWGAGTSVGWLTVPGASDNEGKACSSVPMPANCGRFHYDVDAASAMSSGTVVLTSTGMSRGVSRSVQVALHRMGFAEFLYFTDIESVDPANPFVYGTNNSTAQTRCSRHFWDTPPRDTSYCRDISFTGRDVLNGPLHSNDALLLSGSPRFNGPVSTSYPACAPNASGTPPPSSSCYRGSSATPVFAKGISYASEIQLPPTNAALRAQTVAATSNGAPGCLYTGPTRIVFNSNGTMTVTSPHTQSINVGCGTLPLVNRVVAVPNNNVIFVQNVPTSQAAPSPGNCAAGSIGGFPQAGDVNYNYGAYDCRGGTAFVEGVLQGRATLGADNNVLITGNITHAGGLSGTDALGLVAGNSVEVYHPVNSSSANMNRPSGTPFANPVIQAAILSLNHSFGVQVYPYGNPLGTLTVFGSISQKYRGAVGTFSGTSSTAGYDKNYSYDPRLKYAPPPFFLDPVSTAYGVATFAEVRKVY